MNFPGKEPFDTMSDIASTTARAPRTRSGRSVQLTDKASAYFTALESTKINRIFKRLVTNMDQCHDLIRTKASSAVVHEAYKNWLQHFAQYMDSYQNLKDVLSLDERDINESRYKDLINFKSGMEYYFTPRTTQNSVLPDDSVSQITKISRKSRRSTSSSVASEASRLRLEEIQRNAELTAQLATLKQKQELEAAQLELNQKLEHHKLETDLIASKARTDALKAFENDDGDSVTQAKLDGISVAPHHPLQLNKRETLVPVKPGIISKTDLAHDKTKTTAIAHAHPAEMNQVRQNTMTVVQSMQDLPAKEPEVFSGNVFKFPLWLKSFETIVEKRREDATDKLYYLGLYTSGEPREAIEGYLLLDSDKAYREAKETLIDRFGNRFMVADSFKHKLNNWPTMRHASGPELRKFVDFLRSCRTAMSTLGCLTSLDSIEENKRILQKLPMYIMNKWNVEVDRRLYSNHTASSAPFPSFAEFVTFMMQEARLANSVLVSKTEGSKDDKPRKPGRSDFAHTFVSGSEEVNKHPEASRPPDSNTTLCVVCKEQHKLENCSTFKNMTLADRQSTMKAHALCFGCDTYGHRKARCQRRMTCNECGRYHPTLLHDDNWLPQSSGALMGARSNDFEAIIHSNCLNCDDNNNDNEDTCMSECYHSLIVPVELYHIDNPDNIMYVYALIDEQSDACFVTDSVLQILNVPSTPVEVKLATVLAEQVISSNKVSGLVVRGINLPTEIPLPACYSRGNIPAKESQIPRPDTIKKWAHLRDVANQLMPYDETMPIGLLVGINCSRATKPREVINGDEEEPYAIRTALGWGVIGEVGHQDNSRGRTCHSVRTNIITKRCHFAFRTQVNEVSPAQVNAMFNIDFNERCSGTKVSVDDKSFLKIVKDGINYKEDGHFELPLPFKGNVMLPDNRQLAVKRLAGLRRKMITNPKYRDDYVRFMNDLLDQGYAEKVPPDEAYTPGTVWYIPHHAVYHAKKEKIRVVFDCSAEYQGQSLNQHLLQGPDMINNLIGVLCRFREEQIAFTCDIEGMFHQVTVKKEHRNFLRFLWWHDAELDSEPTDYRMTAHLFGAKSSPGCVNFALKTAAEMFQTEFGHQAANFIKNNFYVDDGLKSVPSQQEAIQLITLSQQLCRKGGFRLHKIVANDKDVLRAIPPDDRAKDIQEIDLGSDNLPMERTLGVQWCVQSDSFQFRIDLHDRPLTRRGILSTISSVFDPLGLVAPFMLIGKKILQELCRDGADWDDAIGDDIRVRWEKWRVNIHLLSTLKIPRCYKPRDFGDVCSVELHHFSDASLEVLGQCSYLRLKDDSGRYCTSLVMAKARVAPSKSVTVPRLELAAAVISVKVSNFLMKELNYKDISQVFWTDSKVILGYINNDSRRFHIYVANRVQEIRDHTLPSDWRHVGTKENPADATSRGLDAVELIDNTAWWHGPKFLYSGEPLPFTPTAEATPANDPELRKVTVLSTQATDPDGEFNLLQRLERFSSWDMVKRVIAMCIRFIEKLKKKLAKPDENIHVEELQAAEITVLSLIQKAAFPNELNALQKMSQDIKNRNIARNRNVNLKGSALYRLDPYICKDGLLRVGGRIKRANLPRNITNPVILPRQGHMTTLLIDHHHTKCCHSGRGITLNTIRSSGYWIIAGGAAVTSHVWKCVTCRKLRRMPQVQKMADLPKDRLDPAPPFTYSAVDFFGPFTVKEGRKEMKRYGALFTCLSSRAVHIEVAHSMTTDSFLNAYRRFVCRRGPVRLLRSDRGTNFVGAKGEQAAAMAEMNHNKIHNELRRDDCDWINFQMNVPHSSHMGGVWERMIRCARNALSALLIAHSEKLNDELLRTLLIEAEAIVNSRPLTFVDTCSPDTPVPLSPQQILTLKMKAVMPPPGNFVREDLYCHRRWRRVQYLANEFWSRWRLEFLPTLQERKKWIRSHENVLVDDIVLMVDENLPRNKWPLARVIDTQMDKDGLVRKVKIVSGQSTYERPIHKVIVLVNHQRSSEASTG